MQVEIYEVRAKYSTIAFPASKKCFYLSTEDVII